MSTIAPKTSQQSSPRYLLEACLFTLLMFVAASIPFWFMATPNYPDSYSRIVAAAGIALLMTAGKTLPDRRPTAFFIVAAVLGVDLFLLTAS